MSLLHHVEHRKTSCALRKPSMGGSFRWLRWLHSGNLGSFLRSKKYGVIPDHCQIWYAFLPIISITSGYLIYLLIDTGILALGGTPPTNETTLMINAAGQAQTRASIATESRMLYCFLAGFWTKKILGATNNILDRLLGTFENLGKNKV
jgi:hypothetical protein